MKIIPTDNCDTDTDSEASPSSISSDDIDTDPHLHHDVLAKIAEYICVEDLLRCRAINREWNRALSQELKKRTVLKIESNDKFVEVFHVDRLITESLWIRNVNFLEESAMKEWINKVGPQIKYLKLGSPVNHGYLAGNLDMILSQVLTVWTVSTFIELCPNLKILIVPAPFSISQHGLFKLNAVSTIHLDYLEIGSDANVFSDYDYFSQKGTSSLLLNLFKCVKRVKCMKIINLNHNNFNGINSWGSKDDEGKVALENISELRLDATPMDPRKILSPPSDFLSFQNLQKLTIASFCESNDDFNYSSMFASLSGSLVELVFHSCQCHRNLNCPRLITSFPYTTNMDKLEVFRMIGITEWEEPNLDFFQRLPRLSTLEIRIFNHHITDRHIGRMIEESTTNVYPAHLRNLILGCGSDKKNIFNLIPTNFPVLQSLDMEYYGKYLPSVITALSGGKITDLRLTINCYFGSHCVNSLITSGIKQLTITFKFHRSHHRLFFNISLFRKLVDVESENLREITLIGMKVDKKEYLVLNEMLSVIGIRISLYECTLEDAN